MPVRPQNRPFRRAFLSLSATPRESNMHLSAKFRKEDIMRNLSWSRIHIIAIAALFLLVLLNSVKAAQVIVSDAWIRALPTSVPSGGYFTLHNSGSKPLTLKSASSPACGMLMLHLSENVGGMTNMEDVSSVDVPPGGTIKFSPGGYHLMCMNATKAIQPGKTVPVTLGFSDGTNIVSEFAVRNAAGK